MSILFKRRLINILLIFGIFFLIMLGIASYLQLKKINHVRSWVIHSHHVIEVTNNTLIGIYYAESYARGYFLTKKPLFLNNFKTAVVDINANLNELFVLTRDNARQYNKAKLFSDRIHGRIDDLNYKINIFQQNGLKALLNSKTTPNGEVLTKEIRTIGDDFIKSEKEILHARNKNAGSYTRFMNSLIMYFDLLGLALILIGAVMFNQQDEVRTKIENKLKKSEIELYNLAYYDPLTGLANRSLLYFVIENAIRDSNKHGAALLYLDLDNFKYINDSLGHEIGDALLKLFARKLKKIVSHFGVVSRVGGDEFIIVLNHFDKLEQVVQIAKNMLSINTSPLRVQNHQLFVSMSIGISVYPTNGMEADTLMKAADIAMYRAKELGKNNYQFCLQEMTKQVEEQALLHNKLHHAMSNEEFTVLYQPIISLKDNRVVAVEALIRWNNPEKGLIYPADFIMLAESNGLIAPIGEWLLQTVCDDVKHWLAQGALSFKVALNISPRQFLLGDFVSAVNKIIKHNDFNPELLEFEITESVLLVNTQNNIEALRALKNLGISIIIDDFGTGYSSLSYLQSLTIDKLKIDKSFISQINLPNHNPTIIKAIITMAHSLNIAVVAEGVETIHQINFLKVYHCDEVQGFYYSKPLSAAELMRYMRTGAKDIMKI